MVKSKIIIIFNLKLTIYKSYLTAPFPLAKPHAILTYSCVKEDRKKKTMWIPTTTARDEDKELLY